MFNTPTKQSGKSATGLILSQFFAGMVNGAFDDSENKAAEKAKKQKQNELVEWAKDINKDPNASKNNKELSKEVLSEYFKDVLPEREETSYFNARQKEVDPFLDLKKSEYESRIYRNKQAGEASDALERKYNRTNPNIRGGGGKDDKKNYKTRLNDIDKSIDNYQTLLNSYKNKLTGLVDTENPRVKRYMDKIEALETEKDGIRTILEQLDSGVKNTKTKKIIPGF